MGVSMSHLTVRSKLTLATCVVVLVLSLGLLAATPQPLMAGTARGFGSFHGGGFSNRGFGFHHSFFYGPSFSFFYGGFGPYYYYPYYPYYPYYGYYPYYPAYYGPGYGYPGPYDPPSYRMTYDDQDNRSSSNSQLAWLRIDVQPREASIYIDGQYAGKASEFAAGKKLLPVSPASHTLRFEAEGYQTAVVDLKVNPLQTLDVTQILHPGKSLPDTASPAPPAAAPPRNAGRTPPPVRQPYSSTSSRSISGNPTPSDTPGSEPAAVPQPQGPPPAMGPGNVEGDQFGRIVVKFDKVLPEAAVYVDSRFMGITDPASLEFVVNDVPPGRHTLVVTKPGYKDFQVEVTVSESQSNTVTAAMQKR